MSLKFLHECAIQTRSALKFNFKRWYISTGMAEKCIVYASCLAVCLRHMQKEAKVTTGRTTISTLFPTPKSPPPHD